MVRQTPVIGWDGTGFTLYICLSNITLSLSPQPHISVCSPACLGEGNTLDLQIVHSVSSNMLQKEQKNTSCNRGVLLYPCLGTICYFCLMGRALKSPCSNKQFCRESQMLVSNIQHSSYKVEYSRTGIFISILIYRDFV